MRSRQLRRLDPAVGQSLHDRMASQTLHSVYWRRYMDEAEPFLIDDDGNLLAAIGRGGARLVYGFASDRAFSNRFPAMFDDLLPRIRRDLAADTVRFRLEHAPSRALVEPVLKRLWFKPARDWIEFALERQTKVPAAPAPKGIRVREGSVDDAEELVRIDRAAFPDTPILLEDMRRRVGDEQLIVATHAGVMAGFCLFSQFDPGEGYISVLAVDEAYRGMGIGAMLTVRASKRLFAEGARRVRLTTDDGNGDAIRLYVRLGFKQSAAGRDYTRPADPRVIEQMQKQGEGIVIRFGGWR